MLNVMCHEMIQKINQETLVSYDLETVISPCLWQLESLTWLMHGVGPLSSWWLLGPASVHHAIMTYFENVCQLISHKAIGSCPLENSIEIALGFMTLLQEANTVVSIILCYVRAAMIQYWKKSKASRPLLEAGFQRPVKEYNNRE